MVNANDSVLRFGFSIRWGENKNFPVPLIFQEVMIEKCTKAVDAFFLVIRSEWLKVSIQLKSNVMENNLPGGRGTGEESP